MLGWVLFVGWAVWLVTLWVTQPRLVPQELLADELSQGRATGYRVVTVDEDGGGRPWAPYRLDVYPASDAEDGALDGTSDGQQVTVAYWVDAPVARLRVLDPDGLGSDVPAALVSRFRAAGVQEVAASSLYAHPPGLRVDQAGALLLFVSTLVVVLGPRPRRGTRWFWFWVVGGPLALGVPLFAVTELLRPRYEPAGTVHPPGVAGRWSGLTGFALGFVASLVGTAVLMALGDVSPIWFIRG